MIPVLAKTLLSGSAVSLVTSVALAALASREGRHAVQPLNSTSHWYAGEDAGRSQAVDLRHTVGGYATHHAASVLWAAVFEAVRRIRPGGPPLGHAVAVSALAALVDYGVVPKRLTPGWEHVVTPRSIALTYAAMAVTLAIVGTRGRGRRG